jgi:hypothetical protein
MELWSSKQLQFDELLNNSKGELEENFCTKEYSC